MKAFLQKALIRNAAREFVVVNTFLAFITIVSIIFFALETVDVLAGYDYVFRVIEYVAVSIFTLEYLARIYAKEDRFGYIFSFFGAVDLIAIVPTYLGVFNLTFLKAARIARALEFMKSLRLAKLSRINKYSNSKSKKFLEVQVLSMRIYALILGFAVFFFGTILYFIEGTNYYFKDIPSGVLWVTQTILGGNVNVGEVGLPAQLTILAVQFTGLLLFGLLIHIVGRFLERKILGSSNTLN